MSQMLLTLYSTRITLIYTDDSVVYIMESFELVPIVLIPNLGDGGNYLRGS